MFIQTDFSLLKSKLLIKDAISIVKEKGFKKIVLSDTNLSGLLEFYYASKEADLEPVIALQSIFEGVKYLFIAHNKKGLEELFFYEYHKFSIEAFSSENLTAIALDIISEDFEINSKFSALKNVKNINDISINKELLKNTIELPIKIANISSIEDIYALGALNGISNGGSRYEESIIDHRFDYNLIQEKGELVGSKDLLKILSNTVDDFKFGDPTPPSFPFLSEELENFNQSYDMEVEDFFRFLVYEGAKKRYKLSSIKDLEKSHKDRLDYELSVINGMNFPGYFLILWDFVKAAKEMGIAVGPGRGSAAGSLVVFCLYVTNIDPMKYDLLFERFLNPKRVNLPDIDMDFCQERRAEIIDYCIEKYGKEKVAQVITFGSLKAKGAIKDSARVLGEPLFMGEKLSKLIPEDPTATIEKSYKENSPQWDKVLEDPNMARIFELSKKIENYKKNTGIHAAGVVISDQPIWTKGPLYDQKGIQVVGLDGNYLEDLDLVKYDFLGLKTLTIIQKCQEEILRLLNKVVDFDILEPNDPEVFNYISTGQTIGMFQIESEGMQDLNKRLKPDTFEDLIAILALYRPGPMEAGMLDSFIDRKHGREKVDYFNKDMEDLLKPILLPTYGLIVYQEQVIKIVQVIGGFSLGKADLVRRAMGKKKEEEMKRISKEFVMGAEEKGFKRSEAKDLFDLIEKFAGYGFNKSHSAAYALVTYQTAWLKFYFPEIFLSVSMNYEFKAKEKLVKYINEAKRLGIELVKPNVLISEELFKAVPDKKQIVFGLRGIKGVGSSSNAIINAVKEVSDNLNIFEIFKYSQTDLTKLVPKLESRKLRLATLSNGADTRFSTAFRMVNKLESGFREGSLTQKQLNSYNNNTIKCQKERDSILLYNEESNSISKKLEKYYPIYENSGPHEKIKTSVFKALTLAGAFDSFGFSRKLLIDNMDKLLLLKTIDSKDLVGVDFSLSEKMIQEKEVSGMILSDPFSKKFLDSISNIEIPEDMPLGMLIGNPEKQTKKGKSYFNPEILLPNGDIVIASDFQGVTSKLKIGDIISAMLRINGNFKNISSAKIVTSKVLDNYPVKMITKKITILEDISDQSLLNTDKLEVYDLNGIMIATFSKRNF